MTTSGHNVGLEEEKPMNDTPRTDVAWKTLPSVYDFIVEMKRIERELNAANAEIERLRKANLQLREGAEEQKQRIKRLEEALEGTVKCFVDLADSGDAGFWNPDEQSVIIAARAALEAKEAKP